ncbi:NADH-quinone oxidoreductase subunit NuoE [Elusimicrobiota bacterium]
MKPQKVLDILKEHSHNRGGLISILQDVQTEYGYLPEEALRTVASSTGRDLIDVYGVASFYSSFSLKPRGKHIISVCLGTACHVRGGEQIAAEFERKLKISAGETTSDGEFTLETVNCLGCCAIGPVAVVDGQYHGQVNPRDVDAMVKSCKDKTKVGVKK